MAKALTNEERIDLLEMVCNNLDTEAFNNLLNNALDEEIEAKVQRYIIENKKEEVKMSITIKTGNEILTADMDDTSLYTSALHQGALFISVDLPEEVKYQNAHAVNAAQINRDGFVSAQMSRLFVADIDADLSGVVDAREVAPGSEESEKFSLEYLNGKWAPFKPDPLVGPAKEDAAAPEYHLTHGIGRNGMDFINLYAGKAQVAYAYQVQRNNSWDVKVKDHALMEKLQIEKAQFAGMAAEALIFFSKYNKVKAGLVASRKEKDSGKLAVWEAQKAKALIIAKEMRVKVA